MSNLNPNVEVPWPKTVMLKKAAIDLVEFDHARELARACGEEVFNLSQPADPLNLQFDLGNDLPAYIYSATGALRRPGPNTGGPRKRHRDYKCNEFVDSTRAIIGSS